MSASDDGGPAFPKAPDEIRNGSAGMTLRDYFAEQALVGIMSSDAARTRAKATDAEKPDVVAASWAYSMADAMLAERSK